MSRSQKQNVKDLWFNLDGTRSARHRKGRRYLARFLAPDGREVSRAFETVRDADMWIRTQRNAAEAQE